MSQRLLLLTPDALASRPSRAADLYRRRVAAGLTQADLAAVTGIDRGAISAYETGRFRPSCRQQARMDAAIELMTKKAAGPAVHPAAAGEGDGTADPIRQG